MKAATYLLTAACLLSPAWPLQVQAGEGVSAQVNQLFAQAQAAFAKGDKNGACDAYKAAWALQKSYDIAGNLGGVELKLGRYRDAAEHLAFALDDFPPTGSPAQRKAVESKLAEALKEVGRMHVRVSVNGASVTVNGTPLGTSPVGSTTYVDPGTLSVEAKLTGYIGARQTIILAKGGEADVTLALVLERRKPNLALVIGGSAASAVGIGSGIGLLVAAGGKARDADALVTQGKAAGITCATPPQPGKCSDLHDKNAASDTLHNAAVPVLVIGAAFAAATVTYGLWPRGGAERSAGVELIPMVGASGGGLLMSGRF